MKPKRDIKNCTNHLFVHKVWCNLKAKDRFVNGAKFPLLRTKLRYFLINEVGNERIPIRVTLPISEDYFSDLSIVLMQQGVGYNGTPNTKTHCALLTEKCTLRFSLDKSFLRSFLL